jgi:hypothetical protein
MAPKRPTAVQNHAILAAPDHWAGWQGAPPPSLLVECPAPSPLDRRLAGFVPLKVLPDRNTSWTKWQTARAADPWQVDCRNDGERQARPATLPLCQHTANSSSTCMQSGGSDVVDTCAATVCCPSPLNTLHFAPSSAPGRPLTIPIPPCLSTTQLQVSTIITTAVGCAHTSDREANASDTEATAPRTPCLCFPAQKQYAACTGPYHQHCSLARPHSTAAARSR